MPHKKVIYKHGVINKQETPGYNEEKEKRQRRETKQEHQKQNFKMNTRNLPKNFTA